LLQIEEEAEEHDDELAEKDVAWVGSVCTHFSASFRNCCRSLYPPISRSCSNLCTFTMTIDQIQTFLTPIFSKGMPPCQNDELQKVLACAADDADVRNCCEQNGVFDDTSRHCLQFCHPSNKVLWNTFFTADIRYLRCVDFYEAFMYCFLQGRLRSVLNIQS
uniref:DB domain-containing protein n=1 Tax=Soboliphyme baturini TaxID=241478 RepID=A0A183IEC3_9BILA